MPTLHALDDGYDVYVVTDASGGVSAEGHDMAVRRVNPYGVGPARHSAGPTPAMGH